MGIVVAALVTFVNPGGEPSISAPSWTDRSIWFAILGIVGAVNALLVYFGSLMIHRLNAGQRKSRR